MNTPSRQRSGYTLMELLVASASASVLLVGLSSSLYVSSQTLDLDQDSVVARSRDARLIDRMLDDLSEALQFSEQTATAVTFTVPDRDGDGRPEEIRYAWSDVAGAPLVYTFNGVEAHWIDSVQSMSFEYVLRQLDAAVIDGAAGTASVVFESHVDALQGSDATSISIGTPPGVAEGDLLIAAVAIDGEPDNVSNPSGWTRVDLGEYDGRIAFGVWWKLAGASEPASHSISWDESNQAYGWIMRFSGHDAISPIHAVARKGGKSDDPDSPAVTTTVDSCMILRLGGFDSDDVDRGDAGVLDHTTICADNSNSGSGSASGAAAYKTLEAAGDAGSAEFKLGKSQEYRTVTIAIAPDTSN